jgi:hypothetical protein
MDQVENASSFSALSCPFEGDLTRTSTTLLTAIAEPTCRMFLERFGEALGFDSKHQSDLTVYFTVCPTFKQLWTSALPACLVAVVTDDVEAARSAACDLVLHGCQYGLNGSYAFLLPKPRIVLLGSRLVKLHGITYIDGDAGLVCNGHAEYRVRSENKLGPDARKLQPSLCKFEVFDKDRQPTWFDLDIPLVSKISAIEEANLREAYEILSSISPLYYEWVSLVVNHIAVVDAPDARICSASSSLLWGTVAITASASPLRVCEMLIHEASHQYFHLFERLFSPACPDKEFFSPLKNRLRPLSKLMLGYHAFGNVFLFFACCAAIPPLRDECLKYLPPIASDLRQLAPPVEDPNNWTPFGTAIIQPLVAQLRKVGL